MTKEHLEAMLDDYYDLRGWEKTTGNPMEAKMRQVGLEFAISHMMAWD